MVRICIVGGSVAGLSTAHALLYEGCEVVVLERASSIVPAGAALGLDALTSQMLEEYGFGAKFTAITRPVPMEEHRIIDHTQPSDTRKSQSVIVHVNKDMVSAHWSDLHRMLAEGLPEGMVRFSHKVVAFQQSDAGITVTAEARGEGSATTAVDFQADFLMAADGANSTIRKLLIPQSKRRYSGMVAWRGLVKGEEHPDLMQQLQREYPQLERGVTFEMNTAGSSNVLYMIPPRKINWLWYRAAPEPDLPGHSVTKKPTPDDLAELHKAADEIWTPAFASLIKATEQPFINVIYDREPLDSWIHGRVALLGEAAHSTTPHAGRSTNMSLQDAFTLGRCYREHGPGGFLEAFQSIRRYQTAREVLFSRHLGELRQGWWVDPAAFDWPSAPEEVRRLWLNANKDEPDYKGTTIRLLTAAGAHLSGALA